MPLGRIIVPVSGTRLLESKLDHALALARRFDSRIDVLFVHGATDPLTVDQSSVSDAARDTAEIEWSREAPTVSEVQELVDRWLQARSVARHGAPDHRTGPRVAFLELRSIDSPKLRDHAHTSDLIVIGQLGDRMTPLEAEINRLSVMESGRIVLVVPEAAPAAESMFTRALIAWDAGLRVSRTVSFALPILSATKQVTVYTSADPSSAGNLQHLLLDYLACNGITADLLVEDLGTDRIGDVLVGSAEKWDVSLICMGAYEHARTVELLIGGNTWHVYAHSKVPALFSR